MDDIVSVLRSETSSSNAILECNAIKMEMISNGNVFFYLQFLMWIPLVVFGIVGHIVLLISLSEKFVIYVQPHYLILASSFSLNCLLYLISVAPVIFSWSLLSSNVFTNYVICSQLLSNLFLYNLVLILSLFGYQRILSFIHLFKARLLIYKKHTVDVVAVALFISFYIVCLEIYHFSFELVCGGRGDHFTILKFSKWKSSVTYVSRAVFLLFLPTIMIGVHVFAIVVTKLKIGKYNVGNIGLSSLTTTKVFIVTDEMRDSVNLVLYAMFMAILLPALTTRDVIQFQAVKYANSHWILSINYFLLIFNAFNFIPFFVLMRPLRTSILSKLKRFTEEKTIERAHSAEISIDTKNDTLLSIGSIERSRHEAFNQDEFDIDQEKKVLAPSSEIFLKDDEERRFKIKQ